MTGSVFFGVRKSDRAKIYLGTPSWECDWYWGGFGHLGNRNEHYHLSSHMRDGYLLPEYLTEVYELNPLLNEKKLWTFCELMTTAYALNRAAEVLTRGGSHLSLTPMNDVIQDLGMASILNESTLPKIFAAVEELFHGD